MNFSLDTGSDIPAYMQLYEKLVKDIIEGVYSFGNKLPSKRTIAVDAGLSLITVEHAIDLLCEEGYIDARQRSGYFVIYRSGDFFGNADHPAASPPIKEDIEYKLPDETRTVSYTLMAKTMRRVIQNYGEKILVKSPNHGCSELRNEICLYLARSRGIRVEPSQIIIGSGAEYLYGLVVQLLGTEEYYAVEDPCYEKIVSVYRAMGARLEKLKLSRGGISSKELSSSRARFLHVTPFHSYPGGITAGISKKHEYLRWAEDRDGILIEDNYDSELTISSKPEEPLYAMADKAKVIYINTFSKTVAPSMRVGYMILPECMQDEFDKKLGFYSCTVPMFEQLVLAELIRNGDFERHINKVRRIRRKQER